MMPNSSRARARSSSERAVFAQEATRAERAIAVARLALTGLMLVADLALVYGLIGGARPVPEEVLVLDGAFLLFAGGAFWWLQRREATRALRFFAITCDYLFAAAYVWQLHAWMGLDVELVTATGVAAWALLVLLSALRFNLAATLYAAALSFLLCIGSGLVMGAKPDTVIFAAILAAVAGASAAYLSWRHGQAVHLIVQRARFQRFLPQGVVDNIIAKDEELALGGKKIWATVLFTDLRDFTTMSEALDPLEVVAFLNEYLSGVVDVVFEHLGTVDKFIGDAVMAVFGAPFTREDDAERAVQCALAIQEAMARWNASRVAQGGEPIQVGIGVHTGWVVAGTIGGEERMEYTVVGDTVNVAARLQGLTRDLGENLLLSRATADAVGERIALQAMGTVQVKGRAETIEVFTVAGEPAGAPSTADLPSAGAPEGR